MPKERINKSRNMLARAADFAIGSYMEQESKKEDMWRDESWWNMYKHISHEIEEIKRSDTIQKKVHNAADLASLALIVLARTMEEAGYFQKECI